MRRDPHGGERDHGVDRDRGGGRLGLPMEEKTKRALTIFATPFATVAVIVALFFGFLYAVLTEGREGGDHRPDECPGPGILRG